MSAAIDIPTGPYTITIQDYPLTPGKPNEKMHVPSRKSPRATWYLEAAQTVPGYEEAAVNRHYVLRTDDRRYYLGVLKNAREEAAADVDVQPGLGQGFLTNNATITADARDAWTFTIEKPGATQHEYVPPFTYNLAAWTVQGGIRVKTILAIKPEPEELGPYIGTVDICPPAAAGSFRDHWWTLRQARGEDEE